MISKISIIGTGLLGSSLGLAIRRRLPDLDVSGFDRIEILQIAKDRDAVTSAASSLEESVRNADLIVLATPLDSVEEIMTEIAPFLKTGAIVTDVCSVKKPVHEAAKRLLPPSVRFVGGHPMAGSENAGPKHADEFLFENATYVLCPADGDTIQTFESECSDLLSLLRMTGARIMLLSAASHDRIAAAISHLPQLLSVGLVHSASIAARTDSEVLDLAAGGFRDMTRIASSPYAMWDQILAANSDEVLCALDTFMIVLNEIRSSIAPGGPPATAAGPGVRDIEYFFQSAESTRASIPERNKGFLRPLADVFVFITDESGAIHRMTGALSHERINIRDIELLKIREGTGGTFRIGLESEKDAENALDVLGRAGFKAHRLS